MWQPLHKSRLVGIIVKMGHVAVVGISPNRSGPGTMGTPAGLAWSPAPVGLKRTLLLVTSTPWGMEVLET